MRRAGELVLVATPIGNLGDLAPRAAEAIGAADLVCCEDTRHSGQLFARAGVVPKRLVSLHAHNEVARSAEVLGLLAEGQTVALVSDAGLPGVSDPGGRLIDLAHQAGVKVSAVPGPTAGATALALSGFPAERWCFEGFLPRKGTERKARLAALSASSAPSVIYEAPGRVEALLSDLVERCGPDRLLLVCRELTKLHEEVWRGPLGAAVERWPAASARGEFVLVLAGAEPAPAALPGPGELAEAVARLVAAGESRRDAVAEVAERHGLSRRLVYEAVGPAAPKGAPPTSL